MKIILGCDPLLMPLTGIGHYTMKLANGIHNSGELEQLELFAHGKFFPKELIGSTYRYKTIEKASLLSKLRQKLALSECAVTIYQSIQPIINKIALYNHQDFIYHSPNFILPSFEGKKVVTIHDLSTINHPEFHPKSRVKFINNSIYSSINKADHIITVSNYVKNEINQLLGVDKRNISVIPLGADDSFQPRSKLCCHKTLKAYELKFKEYFLFVSTIEPRKNLGNLLDAYTRYRERQKKGKPLILVGGEGWNNLDILQKISALESKGWVKYLGYISQSDIPILFSGAKAVLFPSFYEGFGLPVLEAMQSATPVLTSPNSSMEEICSGSAILSDPTDIDEISFNIERLSEDEELCNKLSRNGIKRAKNYSWQRCISETIDIYKSL